MDRNYFVYILSSRSRTLYTGVTNNVVRRVMQHRLGRIDNFTSKYRIHRLVRVETFGSINAAIAREKQIKSWRREKRVALVEAHNPTWVDLMAEWAPPYPHEKQIPRSARDDRGDTLKPRPSNAPDDYGKA